MKFLIFMLFALSINCGKYNPCNFQYNFNTSGITICSEAYIDPSDIDDAVSALNTTIRNLYPNIEELPIIFGKLEVKATFTKQQIKYNCELIDSGMSFCDESYYSGFASNFGPKIYMVWDKCIGRTAFIHELIHVILKEREGDPDRNHENLEAWKAVLNAKKDISFNCQVLSLF